MKISYDVFLRSNKATSRETVVHIIGVDFKADTCTYLNESRETYRVPIPILVLSMLDDMMHINDASKLKKWTGWNTEIDYPNDYFTNMDKYFVPV